MAVAAMIALLHDLVITAGLYSLVGFEVTPATVIGFLTILGYSLYDTVVVFDKVRENTAGLAGGSRMTYSQAANLAVNQTLVRSINTSIIALLPIAAHPVRRRRAARRRAAQGPGAGAVHRCRGRRLLLDLHRHAAARRASRSASPRCRRWPSGSRAGAPAPAPTTPSARRGGGQVGDVRVGDGRRRRRRPHDGRSGAPRRAARRDPSPATGAAAAPGRRRPAQPAAQGQRQPEQVKKPGDRRLPRPVTARGWLRPDPRRPGLPRARASSSRTSPRCSPTPRPSPRSIEALPRRTGQRRRQGGRHRGARVHPRRARWRSALGVGFRPGAQEGQAARATRRGVVRAGVRLGDDRGDADAFAPGDRVLVVDDVLATGGTAAATVDLVRRCGAEVVGVVVLLELGFLSGREMLAGVDAPEPHALLLV